MIITVHVLFHNVRLCRGVMHGIFERLGTEITQLVNELPRTSILATCN